MLSFENFIILPSVQQHQSSSQGACQLSSTVAGALAVGRNCTIMLRIVYRSIYNFFLASVQLLLDQLLRAFVQRRVHQKSRYLTSVPYCRSYSFNWFEPSFRFSKGSDFPARGMGTFRTLSRKLLFTLNCAENYSVMSYSRAQNHAHLLISKEIFIFCVYRPSFRGIRIVHKKHQRSKVPGYYNRSPRQSNTEDIVSSVLRTAVRIPNFSAFPCNVCLFCFCRSVPHRLMYALLEFSKTWLHKRFTDQAAF